MRRRVEFVKFVTARKILTLTKHRTHQTYAGQKRRLIVYLGLYELSLSPKILKIFDFNMKMLTAHIFRHLSSKFQFFNENESAYSLF